MRVVLTGHMGSAHPIISISRYLEVSCRGDVFLRLTGKVAIVFGAGPNIGGTIALFLAREGARVAVSDLSPEAAAETVAYIESHGGEATAVTGNALDEADVERVVATTLARFGQLDVVVNMAGTVHWSPIVDMELAAWTKAVMSFPTAGMLTTKHAARAMIAAGTAAALSTSFDGCSFRRSIGCRVHGGQGSTLEPLAFGGDGPAHAGIRVNTITPCAMEHQLWTAMREEISDPAFTPPQRRSFYSRDDYLKINSTRALSACIRHRVGCGVSRFG